VCGVFQYDIVIEKRAGGIARRSRHYEQCVALVEARNEPEARARAHRFFLEQEVVDTDEYLQHLDVKFIGIAEAMDREDVLLEHGSGIDEVYWWMADEKPRMRWPRLRRTGRKDPVKGTSRSVPSTKTG
jgi:hypothetical protein